MKIYTYHEIASDYNLWGEYMDIGAVMTRADFDLLSVAERIQQLRDCFGDE